MILKDLINNIQIQGRVRIVSFENDEEITVFETYDFETASISSEILAKEVKYLYSFDSDEFSGICIEV